MMPNVKRYMDNHSKQQESYSRPKPMFRDQQEYNEFQRRAHDRFIHEMEQREMMAQQRPDPRYGYRNMYEMDPRVESSQRGWEGSRQYTNNHNVEFETISSQSNTNSKLLGKRNFPTYQAARNEAPRFPSVKGSQLHESPSMPKDGQRSIFGDHKE